MARETDVRTSFEWLVEAIVDWSQFKKNGLVVKKRGQGLGLKK